MPAENPRTTVLGRAGQRYLNALRWLVEVSRRYAGAVTVGALLLTAASSYYAFTHIAVNTNTSEVLFRNLPFTRVNAQLDRAFPQLRDSILMVVHGKTPGLAAQAAQRLTDRLQKDHTRFADVYQPGGGEFFRRNGLLYLDPAQIRQMTDKLAQAEPLVAKLAQDPSLRGLLGLLDQALAPPVTGRPQLTGLQPVLQQLTATVEGFNAGRFYQLPWSSLMGGSSKLQSDRQLVIATPAVTPDPRAAGAAAIDTVRQAVRDLELTPANGVNVQLTGAVVLSQDQLQTVTTGAQLSLVLSLALVIILLAVALRSLRMILATLVVLLMGLAWTTAFAVLAIGPFNLISVSFAVLFIGLGVDFGIQFCIRYYEELRTDGSPSLALGRTATGMGLALTLAAVAAALSFFSVVPTDYSGIADLGIIAGTSMFIALFANLTVLPALLVLLRVKRKPGRLREPFSFGFLPVRRFARPILVIAALLGIGAIPLILAARFDINLTKLQNPNSAAMVAFQQLEQSGRFSPLPIEILAPSLDKAEQDAKRLRALSSVSEAVTAASYVPGDQDQKLAIIQEASLLIPPTALQPTSVQPAPDTAALRKSLNTFDATLTRYIANPSDPALRPSAEKLQKALRRFREKYGNAPAALHSLQQRVIGTLPTELSNLADALQAQRITLKSLPTALRSRYIAADGRARIEILSGLDLRQSANLSKFVAQVRNVVPDAGGTPVLFVEGGRAVVSAFRQASILSLVLIAALLAITLRTVHDVLLILLPLVLSGVGTVAAMTFLGIDFNLANIIVLPLLIGLGVAFSIYFVLRWRSGLTVEAIMASSTPGGVLFSALTTLSSFGSLAISPDPGMSILGRTLAIALSVIIVNVLIVLPALLVLLPDRTAPPEQLSGNP
ncbi:MAG: MMPL family transporter [Gammaproteobacteria bacterium]